MIGFRLHLLLKNEGGEGVIFVVYVGEKRMLIMFFLDAPWLGLWCGVRKALAGKNIPTSWEDWRGLQLVNESIILIQ